MLHLKRHFDLFCLFQRVGVQNLLRDVLIADPDNEMIVKTGEFWFEFLGQQTLAVSFGLFHLVVREGLRKVVTVLDRDLVVRAIPDGRHIRTGLPSVSSLLRFVEYDRAGSLAPRFQQRDISVPAWAPLFMECYQKTEKPTVNHAYEAFWTLASSRGINKLPSIWQVRRFLDKVGKVSVEMGRMGDRELKTIRPFIRRSFKDLLPTDVYSADGHTFDAEVQHPLHGRPFRPEITSVVDIATRRLVSWSVGLAESAFAVLDALRDASVKSGIPAIFYVDNGSGYKNQLMTDTATGLLGRLGTEMHNSIPYNSQARGVIERLH